MIDAKTLRLITQSGLQSFAQGRILDGIAALRTLLPYCSAETILNAEAVSLEENYHHMLSFLRSGGKDEKRNDVQAKIQRQGVALLEEAGRTIRIKLDSDLYCNAMIRLKDLYGGQKALLDKWNSILTPEEAGEVQDDLFDLLWTSPFWTAEDTAFWYDFLLQQRDMVQQHLEGAVFLSLWEHYDAEKMQLLGLLAESECHRTHIQSVCHLLFLRLRHKELVPLMPSLPGSLTSRKGKKQVAQVQHELLLMLASEKDLERELKEAEGITKKLTNFFTDPASKGDILKASRKEGVVGSIQDIISLRGRYLRNRLQRGLDINLSKIPLLHNCEYLRRISHWFMPFDKTHPLFQSVMIDEKGNEKQNLNTLVDFILDCDIDKLAMLYLVAHDKDFSKAVQQLDEQELPGIENAVIPEYTFRFIMQDLFRFFGHSPLHSQLSNPFREKEMLLDFPELATLFSIEDAVGCSKLLFELGRHKQALVTLDDVIHREGANASALLLKGQVLRELKRPSEAINLARSAEMLEPENTEVLRFLVECYASQNRFEEELEYLQKLAELLPDDKALPRLIATATDKAGRREEALALYFKLDYEASPDDEDYAGLVASIADTALSLGKLDIAERYTAKELELSDAGKWEAHVRLGHIRLLEGDWKSALNSYEQYINTYCDETGKDINAALATLDKQWERLRELGTTDDGQQTTDVNGQRSMANDQWSMVNVQRSIFNLQSSMNKDLLLIRDILQASATASRSQNPPQPTER